MKKSKRMRFLSSLIALLVCLSFTSNFAYADQAVFEAETTTSEEDTKQYCDGKIVHAEARSIIENYAGYAAQFQSLNLSKEEVEYFSENIASSYGFDVGMFAEAFAGAMNEENFGQYVSYEDLKVQESEEGENFIDVSAVYVFDKTKLNVVVTLENFENLGNVPHSFLVTVHEEDSSFSGKMISATVNTLMGMGTVFVVLILISLIIYCFSFIPKIQAVFSKKEKEMPENEEQTVLETPAVEEDDTELVAVIAAAIAASEGTSTDDFVVRSIRKR